MSLSAINDVVNFYLSKEGCAMSDTSLQQQAARVGTPTRVTDQVQARQPFYWRRELTAWTFLLPLLIVFVLFLLVPILLGFRLSFFNASLVGSGLSQFVGLANYAEALSDPNFWGAVWNTIIFTIISTPILIVLSLVLAVMVNSVRRFQWVYRIAFFAPYTLSITVMVLIWNW